MLKTKLKTYWQLGLRNLLRVAIYRLKNHHIEPPPTPELPTQKPLPKNLHINYFFKHNHPLTHWHADPLTNQSVDLQTDIPWHQTHVPKGFDIKITWEPSRFYWLTQLTQQGHHAQAHDTFINWLHTNPPYQGLNWLCAQEASIRLCNTLLAIKLGFTIEKPLLTWFIITHLKRILPTMSYAIAQCNNHATSEAAALLIGGLHLQHLSPTHHQLAQHCIQKGASCLEERATHLILQDGTFSQYSVTYHRMVVDTFSMVCFWTHHFNQAELNAHVMGQYEKLYQWLYALTDIISGDAPNLGPNDGTHFFKLDDCDYRDFRPTLQLASVLLYGQACFPEGPWDQALTLLNIPFTPCQASAPQPAMHHFSAGGFFKISRDHFWLLLRYPRFRFRPAQSDAFHVDVWHRGQNILRDGGSYSYHCVPALRHYFEGTTAHNTIQFDDHSQMPRLSHFLYGNWLSTRILATDESSWCGEIVDYCGNQHCRRVIATEDAIEITDAINGPFQRAVLRWRLAPEIDWQLSGQTVSGGGVTLTISGGGVVLLSKGWESRYYWEKSALPVLEVILGRPVEVCTRIQFSWNGEE